MLWLTPLCTWLRLFFLPPYLIYSFLILFVLFPFFTLSFYLPKISFPLSFSLSLIFCPQLPYQWFQNCWVFKACGGSRVVAIRPWGKRIHLCPKPLLFCFGFFLVVRWEGWLPGLLYEWIWKWNLKFELTLASYSVVPNDKLVISGSLLSSWMLLVLFYLAFVYLGRTFSY